MRIKSEMSNSLLDTSIVFVWSVHTKAAINDDFHYHFIKMLFILHRYNVLHSPASYLLSVIIWEFPRMQTGPGPLWFVNTMKRSAPAVIRYVWWDRHQVFNWKKNTLCSSCSYRKVPGDSCSGGDVESRLDGEMLPCPVGGEPTFYLNHWFWTLHFYALQSAASSCIYVYME